MVELLSYAGIISQVNKLLEIIYMRSGEIHNIFIAIQLQDFLQGILLWYKLGLNMAWLETLMSIYVDLVI